jgi:hypothetical protein
MDNAERFALRSSLRGANATKQSKAGPLRWIASLALAMTNRGIADRPWRQSEPR